MMSSLAPLLAVIGCGPEPASPPISDPSPAAVDPGFVPIHRLNNTEYRNTLRDLLFTSFVPSVTFSEDPTTAGFDNVADALTVSPLLLEQYELAADEILTEVFTVEDEVRSLQIVQAEGPGPTYDGGQPVGTTEYGFADAGSLSFSTSIEDDGEYELTIKGWSNLVDGSFGQVRLYVDDVALNTFDLTGSAGAPILVTTKTELADGAHTFRLEFANPHPDGDRTLVLDAFYYDGPLAPEVGHSEAYKTLVGVCESMEGAEQATCVDLKLQEFGARAWRRPLTRAESDWLLSVYAEARGLGLGLDHGLQMAFKAALLAPDFVFRFEQYAVDEARPLDGYELASRLSYFLWSSMPDEALFDAAADGSLLTDEGLEAQVDRMLADAKAEALVNGFAAQWLDIRALEDHDPIGELYPTFDEELKASMKGEIERLAADWLLYGTSAEALVLGTQSWMNARLADHYGASGYDPSADEWQLVDTAGLGRQGILTSPAWLTVTSHADRPSSVERGKWIFEELLCTELPPPPPSVEGSLALVEGGGSVRAQEEALRLVPDTSCYACHSQMDPYGHSLGLYDAIGAVRTTDELGYPIDTAVVLPDGTAVDGILDVLPLLAQDPRFTRCIAEKLFVYGTGRTVRPQDASFIEEADATFRSANLDFGTLARHLVLSPPFRMKGLVPTATSTETP